MQKCGVLSSYWFCVWYSTDMIDSQIHSWGRILTIHLYIKYYSSRFQFCSIIVAFLGIFIYKQIWCPYSYEELK